MKGFLAIHDHRLERSHDVERLVELATAYDPRFASLEDAAITLTPYATAASGQSRVLQLPRGRQIERLFLRQVGLGDDFRPRQIGAERRAAIRDAA